jgi:hypothetical protein
MTQAAQKMIKTFEALPEDDQRSVVLEILRRTVTEDYPPVDEADLVLAADQVFLDLDRREERD